MDRLIIESIEGRITLGITMFVALMILIGWVMINEPYRMAAFEEQHLGRSIEQGAELYASNCTSCHGTNGYGGIGVAPALNSPHLFEYDFTAEVNGNIANLQREIRDLVDLQAELIVRRQELTEEFGSLSEEELNSERGSEVETELTLVEAQLNEDVEDVRAQLAQLEEIEEDDLTEEQESLKAALEGNIALNIEENLNGTEEEEGLLGEDGLLAQRDALLEQLSGARTSGYLPSLEQFQNAVPSREEALAIADEAERINAMKEWIKGEIALSSYIAEDASRLLQVGWGGDLRGYLSTTLIHGRPGSNDVWPNAMVSWSQEGGGPLRRDQIDNLVNYIMNWDKGDDWTLADLDNVQQYARLHTDAANVASGGADAQSAELEQPDISAITALTGDVGNGETLYTSLGCSGCHLGGGIGPATSGTWSRTEEERLAQAEFEGWTVEEYIISSIIHPNAYIVEGYAQGIMPANFGDLLSDQDLADILAYIESQG